MLSNYWNSFKLSFFLLLDLLQFVSENSAHDKKEIIETKRRKTHLNFSVLMKNDLELFSKAHT